MKAKTGMTNTQAAVILVRENSRFLEGLSLEEINATVAMATIRLFPANAVITNGSDLAKHLYLVVEGGVRGFIVAPNGEKIIIRWVHPGETMGWSSLMSQQMNYIVSTEAVKHSVVLIWDRATMRSLTVKYPRLLENALLLAHDYLVMYSGLHLALICESAPQRVAHILVQLAKGVGHKVEGGFELRIRNEELANEAHVTIFTVSRLMREWERKGWLRKGRGSVVVRQPDELLRVET